MKIKFPDRDGIFSSIRQFHEANVTVRSLRLEYVGAFEDPVLFLFTGKLVKVENGFPLRVIGSVARQRGAPPLSPYIFVILPEIVNQSVADSPVGNSFPGGQDSGRGRLVAGVPGIGAKVGEGALVLRPDPLEGSFSLDLFEPEMGVVFRGEREVHE